MDLHTITQITLLPTSTERLSISPALLFTKDKHKGKIIIVRLKVKVNSKCEGINYDVDMDRGTIMFTSSVSLPKDDKQLCWVNKLQLGN